VSRVIVAAEPQADVVAVAIVVDGEVLAGQRRYPPEVAGGWELPGGKRRPDESLMAAAVREIEEELTCRVRVRGWLPVAPVSCGPGLTMAVAVADLVSGRPAPIEHSALRWLGPEALDEVAWLGPDRPFLPELADVLLDGSPLPGGQTGGAVRIGGTVRRPTGAWTPAVHDLLAFLDRAGLDAVPGVLGTDVRGREIVTYLPGEVSADGPVSDARLAALAAWTRRYHDIVAEYRPAPTMTWRSGAPSTPWPAGQIICHNDLAPYNVAYRGEAVSGVFDWDMAGPGRPLEDLAFCAWNAVPFTRTIDPVDAARRLRVLASGYGAEPEAILAAVAPRVGSAIVRIRAGQQRGDPGLLALARAGEPDRTAARLASFETTVASIERALRRQ
jgi:8-oxo-dGTP pyrophosphatase MutT (NUDIX family)